jgi:hypothetical protein
MPVVKFVVSKSYPERVAEVVKKRGLKDVSDWELERIRAFLAGEPPTNPGVIRLYMGWEELEEITDMRTNKPFHVSFDPEKGQVPTSNDSDLKPKSSETLRALTLTGKMVEWLRKGVGFSKAAVKQLNSVKDLPKQFPGIEGASNSVSQFLSLYLQSEVREQQIRTEIQALNSE